MLDSENSTWTIISSDLLKTLSVIPVDLFIKLSDVRYVKVYSRNDEDFQEILKKYVDKDVSDFYCRKQDFSELSSYLLSKNINMHPAEKVSVVLEMASTFGVDKKVSEEIHGITNENLQIITSTKNIGLYLSSMLEKGDYLSQHSMMVSFIACLLGKEMGWNSRLVLQKLSFAGILHDITLSGEILLSLQKTGHEESNLSWQEKKKYTKHTENVLALLEKSSEIPPDVGDIISDHHELDINNFFPSKKSTSAVPQINALFALADAFCHAIHTENNVRMGEFLENWDDFYKHYNKGSFKKPLECLKSIIFDKKLNLKETA